MRHHAHERHQPEAQACQSALSQVSGRPCEGVPYTLKSTEQSLASILARP